MIGGNSEAILYAFLGIYIIIIFIISIFIQLYFVRKGSNIFLNIFCIFLLFSIFVMLLIFPLDLFIPQTGTKIFSTFLYWLFYVCGFLIVDQLKSYISNGNFTVITKIISMIKFMAIFMLFYMGLGLIIKLILKLVLKYLSEDNGLSIALKIINTIVNMPMYIAYIMFLGCGLWEVPRDLVIKFYYPLRLKKLCWEITHVMKKYRDETVFIISSINKIKLTQDKIKNTDINNLKKEIEEAKENMKLETDKELKKQKKKIYDDLSGFKELYSCGKYMNEMMQNLKKTAKIFNLEIVEYEDEKELKNKNELVDINTKYKIYCGQIFRINYQKFSIYKEWAEIKTILMEKNDDNKENNNIINENSGEKIKRHDIINSEDLKFKLDNNDKNIDNNKIKFNMKNKQNQINNDNKNTPNIESNQKAIKENDENTFIGEILENSSKKQEGNSEIRKIKDSKNIQNNTFKKFKLEKKVIIYYKMMPIISIFLFIICIAYDVVIIFGQVEYTFKWNIFAGKVLRWFFTNKYVITPIRLFPMFFTLFVVSYSFGNINSDITFCVYAPRQTEPCHMLFFVGMLAKFICPLCFNFIEIMYNEVNLKGNGSKIALYFDDQFGYLNDDNIVIYIVKIFLLFLFLKAFCCTASKCYGNFAYKKNQYLTFHSNYEQKEIEIISGELILNRMNQIYGDNLEQLKSDNIIEYIEKNEL